MPHHHFTLDERMFIQIGLELHKSHRHLARELGVSHTAVNNEVKYNSFTLEYVPTTRVNKPRILELDLRHRRGRGEVPAKLLALSRWRKRLERFARGQPVYDAEVAHSLYLRRRELASQRNLKLEDGNPLAQKISSRLLSKEKGSPEQIAADLNKEGVNICAQTIYNWIKRSHNSKQLQGRLRRKGRRYRYQSETERLWNKTKNKRSIHTRPIEVEQLIRYGDLEGDTIVGRDPKDRILSHVDRATGLVALSLVHNYDSHKVRRQTLKDLSRVFGNGVHTITYDNGTEFSAWEKTEKESGATIYFADPYRSSQRGRNENANGLVRDYFPKGTDFKQITDDDLLEVETILNERSRKRYDWRNPVEQRELLLTRT